MSGTVNMEKLTKELVAWMQTELSKSGGSKIVLGISGGKDSSVVAALSVRAVGKENVYGVLMPNARQDDIACAYQLVELLGIQHITCDIAPMVNAFTKTLEGPTGLFFDEVSSQTFINMPPRIRMTLLYAISQSIEGSRVVNTGNLSERWIGYTTLYGDTIGAFSPLGGLTSEEVMELGIYLNLPAVLARKVPADGLSGKTDEENIGFSYQVLNRYIRQGICEDAQIKAKIDCLHARNKFKFQPMAYFPSPLPILAKDE